MENVVVDYNSKIFQVEELYRSQFEKNTVYALDVEFINGKWVLSVASAPLDNDDIPYTMVMEQCLTEKVIIEALPILIQGMVRAKKQSLKGEEINFYHQAIEELEEIYWKMLYDSLERN